MLLKHAAAASPSSSPAGPPPPCRHNIAASRRAVAEVLPHDGARAAAASPSSSPAGRPPPRRHSSTLPAEALLHALAWRPTVELGRKRMQRRRSRSSRAGSDEPAAALVLSHTLSATPGKS
uniref:Uncharacterized protein n=1 Tax=Oryza glaberrima TaxID=4538 RepID=I1R7J1_ORYGL